MATDRLINSTQGDSIITKLDDIKTAINNQSTAATATPLMDGTATVGTSTKYARENHVHPTDTSRAANVMSDYAVDTARENITTSSTVQGAIEQLEYREELNKTNILSKISEYTATTTITLAIAETYEGGTVYDGYSGNDFPSGLTGLYVAITTHKSANHSLSRVIQEFTFQNGERKSRYYNGTTWTALV